MQITPYYPIHPVLKKHIEYYYFLKTDSGFETKYYAYPHIFQGINIHKHADCRIYKLTTKVFESKQNKYLSIIQGMRSVPLFAHLAGKLDKITIIFKPLGCNQFIRRPLGLVAPNQSQIFQEWDGSRHYREFLTSFYAVDDPDERIAFLEAFLMTEYKPLPETELLQTVISQLTDFEHNPAIGDIAKTLFIGKRTLHRLFKKHVGINPATFKKIARFRHSLKNKLFQEQFDNLTQIGYKSNFYDQSYFNRVYRQLTTENPSSFFKSIDKMADDKFILKFIKGEDL